MTGVNPLTMSKKELDSLKEYFVNSVPDLDREPRIQQSASRNLVVVFKKDIQPPMIDAFFDQLGVREFKPGKNPHSYIIQNPNDKNPFQLLKQISHDKRVRFVGHIRLDRP